jgi:hypothetical protein
MQDGDASDMPLLFSLRAGSSSASYQQGHKAIPKPHKVVDFVVCMCYSMPVDVFLCYIVAGTASENKTAGYAR